MNEIQREREREREVARVHYQVQIINYVEEEKYARKQPKDIICADLRN